MINASEADVRLVKPRRKNVSDILNIVLLVIENMKNMCKTHVF